MLRSMKKLREKYTIMSKEWVLNPPPPALPSSTSIDLTAMDELTRRDLSPHMKLNTDSTFKKFDRRSSKIKRMGLLKEKDMKNIKQKHASLQK